MRSLLADRPDIDASVLDRTREVMDRHFPDAVVTGYEAVAAGLDLPDPSDRHVLATAIHGGANVIVTRNLRDFPADRLAPHAIAAQHPDAFIASLFETDPGAVLAAVAGTGRRCAIRPGRRATIWPPGTPRADWNGIPAATTRSVNLTGSSIRIAVARSTRRTAVLPARRPPPWRASRH